MSTDERIRNRRSFRNPIFILGAVMTIIYIGLGLMLLFRQDFLPKIPSDFRNIFAAMVLIYGTYRGWRVWYDFFKS